MSVVHRTAYINVCLLLKKFARCDAYSVVDHIELAEHPVFVWLLCHYDVGSRWNVVDGKSKMLMLSKGIMSYSRAFRSHYSGAGFEISLGKMLTHRCPRLYQAVHPFGVDELITSSAGGRGVEVQSAAIGVTHAMRLQRLTYLKTTVRRYTPFEPAACRCAWTMRRRVTSINASLNKQLQVWINWIFKLNLEISTRSVVEAIRVG
jgi:hypothetical protein